MFASRYFAPHYFAPHYFADQSSPAGSLAAGSVTATATGPSSASLSCTPATGGTGPYTYQWYRSNTPGFTPGPATALAGRTSPSFLDSGLATGLAYFYVLVATDSLGATAQSAQASATPSYPALVAGAIAGVATGSSASSWTSAFASGGDPPYSYQWYRSLASGFTPGPATALAGRTSPSLSDSGLSPATTYHYTLVTTDSAAEADSASGSITTMSSLSLGSISASAVTASGMTWTGSAATGGTGPYTYQWYRSLASGFIPGSDSIVSGATGTSLVDSGLYSSRTYFYALVATDSLGATATATASHATNAAATVALGTTTANKWTDPASRQQGAGSGNVAISASASGANVLVAGVTGRKVRVTRYALSASAAVNAFFESQESASQVSGTKYLTASAPHYVSPESPNAGHFDTLVGESLAIVLSGAIAVGVDVSYTLEAP